MQTAFEEAMVGDFENFLCTCDANTNEAAGLSTRPTLDSCFPSQRRNARAFDAWTSETANGLRDVAAPMAPNVTCHLSHILALTGSAGPAFLAIRIPRARRPAGRLALLFRPHKLTKVMRSAAMRFVPHQGVAVASTFTSSGADRSPQTKLT